MTTRFASVFLSILFIGSFTYALDQLPGDKYFLVNETPQVAQQGTEPVVNLLAWVQFNSAPPKPPEKYIRQHHFGVWIDFPHDNTCLTTRGLILVRDSKTPVKLYPQDPCHVASGTWFDPYTNRNYRDATEVEIDHVVPLKNAYISGAYQWPWRMRCAYFNFIGNRIHLMPIEMSVNRNKSDHSVEEWLPPNRNYHCDYVANWLRIKAIWRLMMSEAEVRGIAAIITGNSCDKSSYTMPASELVRQRKIAVDVSNECPANPPQANAFGGDEG